MKHKIKNYNNIQGPIFILASERSGTNLLRRRLSEWQSVAYGPSPLHFLKHLYYAQPFYGDLTNNKILKHFLKDALGLAYNHFSPWDVQFTEDDIIEWHNQEWSGPLTAVSVMHAMNTLYAISKGYKTYICKDNNLFDFCYPIADEIPSSRFIYLYRDTRDVVASQLNRPTQTKSIAKLATLWRDEQIKSIQAINSPILQERLVAEVSYEELVQDEALTIKNICTALNINDLSPDTKENAYSEEVADIHEWQNLNKPTTQASLGRYKNQLRAKSVNLIEHIAWHQMKYLHYVPDNIKRPKITQKKILLEKGLMTAWSGVYRLCQRSNLTKGQKQRQKYIKSMKKRTYL